MSYINCLCRNAHVCCRTSPLAVRGGDRYPCLLCAARAAFPRGGASHRSREKSAGIGKALYRAEPAALHREIRDNNKTDGNGNRFHRSCTLQRLYFDLEDGDHSAVVGVCDVGLDDVGLERPDQRLHPFAVLVAVAHSDDVGVGLRRIAGGVLDASASATFRPPAARSYL